MPKAKRTRKGRGQRRRSVSPRAAIEVALAGFAHDVRTPLTGIMALAELLYAADLPDRERRWAAAIKSTGEHLARLTTLAVDAVKAGQANLVLREEPFSPRELAHAVASAVFARGEAKGLKTETAVGRLPSRVAGDAVRLRSALENLVDNAVKFTERGRVAFSAAAEPATRDRVRLIFTVTDSGIGMSAHDLKQLFRPFAQASEEVARRFGGAGLGLVFVKRIAEAMGGRLTVSSRPGQGSTFRLTVLARPAAQSATASRGGKRSRALRVLCVEDNPYGRIVLNAVLTELGHRVSFAGSGEAAVDAAQRGEHDVLLMDVALAGINGLEATRRIRALPDAAGRIPIIGISGHTEANDAIAAHAAGMDIYLRKPATPAELHEALQGVAAARRAGSARPPPGR
jgi:CheY-like chemotaxis protein/nitrogen-specific signal transduction histidine kinase